ncbi:valine--tRNA ligase-like [Neodiprion virginianus]|uniref:valine--tRNA ligase-like n=1 Tax=Neodiprion virginianus TaxID=2961670 RepID=UPI001EE6A393|nr:valine--tRNA ligase-like [Neodiprion virginianus]
MILETFRMNSLRLHVTLRRGYNSPNCYKYCTQTKHDFPTTYNCKDVESKWYDIWEKNKYFSTKHSDKTSFTIILPPPNVTGTLHLGHSLTAVIQDSLARWYRMRGHPVVWVPGLDHAGIATQVVVEKQLKKSKGLSRHDLGKEEFLSHVESWKNEKEDVIYKQLKSFGASLDWSRKFFTKDERCSNAVTEAFVQLAERNLVYRDKSIVNWSPTLRSAISDIEVEYIPVTGKTEIEIPGYEKKITFGQITEFSYKLQNSDEVLTVASTRPETMLGDVAVAVHPEDERYSRYIGSQVWHPFRKTYIPIIADRFVNMTFGTGAVKITPAHDPADLEVAKRHNLEIIDVIDEKGNIISKTELFQGVPRFLVRELILTHLANDNALGEIKDHNMVVPKCSRSGDVIEHLLKEQWFIKCKSMSALALEAVKNGTLKIDPSVHERTWYNWLENIKDWCVSRQLWWGHRIPAYLCSNGSESTWIIARTENEALVKARNKFGNEVTIKQDEDVLDTWFSSALLPFTVMGWPNQTGDYKKFYPLSMLETGHDILFFWVTRMVMLGTELTGQLPFKEILLHGVLCDNQGKKMSKSLGNVITPENITQGISLQNLNEQAKQNYKAGIFSHKELERTVNLNNKMFPNGIPECGNDALRLTLSSLEIKSHYINFDVSECVTNKLFCNKIWQASKFILLATSKHPCLPDAKLSSIDTWILSRLSSMVTTVNEAFLHRNLHLVTSKMKNFFYRDFCDWYLEATKPGLAHLEGNTASGHIRTLIKCLDVSLRIIAPITPYLADELYSLLSQRIDTLPTLKSLMQTTYPTSEEFQEFRDEVLEENIGNVWKVVSTIRSLISTSNIKSKTSEAHVVLSAEDNMDLFIENSSVIAALSRVQGVKVALENNYDKMENCISDTVGSHAVIYLSIKDPKQAEQIQDRIKRKVSALEGQMNRLLQLTSAPGYIAKAPVDVQSKHLQKKDRIRQELEKLRQMRANSA